MLFGGRKVYLACLGLWVVSSMVLLPDIMGVQFRKILQNVLYSICLGNWWIPVDRQCLWLWQWSYHKSMLKYWTLLQPCHQSLCGASFLLSHSSPDANLKTAQQFWQIHLWQKPEINIHHPDTPIRSLHRFPAANSSFWVLWPLGNNRQLSVQKCQSRNSKLVR